MQRSVIVRDYVGNEARFVVISPIYMTIFRVDMKNWESFTLFLAVSMECWRNNILSSMICDGNAAPGEQSLITLCKK